MFNYVLNFIYLMVAIAVKPKPVELEPEGQAYFEYKTVS